jgi:two-component system CheB/CheR fusion protein
MVARALVVDDEVDLAEMFAMFFQQAGYEVTTALSAGEALEIARANAFDIVLSDIGMPGMNGYELVAALRALPNYQKVPMIAATGFAMYDDCARSLQAGFDHHLVKPLEMQKFIGLLTKLRGDK